MGQQTIHKHLLGGGGGGLEINHHLTIVFHGKTLEVGEPNIFLMILHLHQGPPLKYLWTVSKHYIYIFKPV